VTPSKLVCRKADASVFDSGVFLTSQSWVNSNISNACERKNQLATDGNGMETDKYNPVTNPVPLAVFAAGRPEFCLASIRFHSVPIRCQYALFYSPTGIKIRFHSARRTVGCRDWSGCRVHCRDD